MYDIWKKQSGTDHGQRLSFRSEALIGSRLIFLPVSELLDLDVRIAMMIGCTISHVLGLPMLLYRHRTTYSQPALLTFALSCRLKSLHMVLDQDVTSDTRYKLLTRKTPVTSKLGRRPKQAINAIHPAWLQSGVR